MIAGSKIYALFLVAAVLSTISAQASALPTVMPTVCTATEELALPCVCCKKACWYGITDMTTSYFGHMPGERTDAEAKFTLAMMRQCFAVECADVCPQ
ncbi:unnamed protein product [Caenorhabditis sp. 36 PRJEB53466]|nr:unnamed protein product [Caenorhabditis sp. 36 PRJEB53466]